MLGVSRTASDKDIKRAFRKLALKLHPDVNKAPGAAKAFTAAKEAYETLSDVKRRREYDISLETGRVGGLGGEVVWRTCALAGGKSSCALAGDWQEAGPSSCACVAGCAPQPRQQRAMWL